jgi:lysozyme
MAYVPGIDVSYWEAGIAWKKVRGHGIYFMFAKATEGEGYVDPTFDDNWVGAKSVGILRGAYHFFHPNMNPVKQADKFIEIVKAMNDNGELPPVLDLEMTDNQPAQVIIERAKTWLDRVQQRLGKRPIIYSSPGFLKSSFVVPGGGPPLWANEYPLWIAHYGVSQPSLPKGWLKWTFWQYSESGTVKGINAAVDLNWFNGTVEELYQFAGSPPPTATTYIVKQGDTLPGIADQFGLSLMELVRRSIWLSQENVYITSRCFQNVAASRSLAKQSPVRRTKLTLRRLLQRHKPPLRNDMAILSSILEKTMPRPPCARCPSRSQSAAQTRTCAVPDTI